MPTSPPETRASLILRLPDAQDVAAWDEVAAVYGPAIYRSARRRGLQPADADDLVQEVFAAVARSIEAWLEKRQRGRFRAWLLRITRNMAINFLTRSKYGPLTNIGCDAVIDPASCADQNHRSAEFDAEYRRQVFRWAARRVREAVTERTWQAFWQSTLKDRPIADVADELGMTIGSVYIARSRIMARLRDLVREFQENES